MWNKPSDKQTNSTKQGWEEGHEQKHEVLKEMWRLKKTGYTLKNAGLF